MSTVFLYFTVTIASPICTPMYTNVKNSFRVYLLKGMDELERASAMRVHRPVMCESHQLFLNLLQIPTRLISWAYTISIRRVTNRLFLYCRIFEQVRVYFRSKSQSIPMSFVLGFYVTLVVRRWWEQYRLLPWPDTLALFVSAAIPGAVSK